MEEVTEQKLVGLVDEKYKEAQHHQLPFNKRRLDNYAQYTGKHQSTWSPVLQKMVHKIEEEGSSTLARRRSINLQPGMVLSFLAKMNKPPSFKFLPATREQQDIYTAAVADVVVPYYLRELQIQGMLGLYTDLAAIIFGDAFLKVYWNPEGGRLVDVNGQMMKTGAMAACMRSPLAFSIDPIATSIEEADWAIEYTVRSLASLKRAYPNFEFREEAVSEVGTYQMKLKSYFDNRSSITPLIKTKSAMIKEYYEAPSSDYPEGRIITTCNSKLLDYKEQNPYGCFPYIRFGAIPLPERFESISPIQMTKPAQEGYNMMFSILEDWYRRARPKIIAQTGTLRGKMTNMPFEVIEYDPVTEQPPIYSPPPPLPQDIFAMKNQYRIAFDERIGILPVTQGNQPPNVRSADQLNALVENDHVKFGPLIIARAESMEKVARLILKNAQKFVVVPEIARIIGKHMSQKILSFTRADLQGNVDIRIVPGSMLPHSIIARLSMARENFVAGLYGTPGTREARLRYMAHVGDNNMFLPPFEDDNMASETAQDENGRMNMTKIIEPPGDWEPDDIHLYYHNMERNMPDFKRRPEKVRQAFQIHTKWHERNMMLKASGMAVQQTTPRPVQEAVSAPGAARPIMAGQMPMPMGRAGATPPMQGSPMAPQGRF